MRFRELELCRANAPLNVSQKLATGMQTISYHLKYYQSFLLESWDKMSPMQYGSLLVAIAVIGWLLMRHGAAQ